MSMLYNGHAVIVRGNLGADPEVRTTASGREFLTFSAASTRRLRPDEETGEVQEVTTWFRCLFSQANQIPWLVQNLKKGHKVVLVGYLRTDPNTGGPRVFARQDGGAGASNELICEEVITLGSGRSANDVAFEAILEEDDIPF